MILEFFNSTWKITKLKKNQIFEHDSALNYATVKNFPFRRLDLNTKKHFHTIFEFSIISGNFTKFEKFRFSNITWF